MNKIKTLIKKLFTLKKERNNTDSLIYPGNFRDYHIFIDSKTDINPYLENIDRINQIKYKTKELNKPCILNKKINNEDSEYKYDLNYSNKLGWVENNKPLPNIPSYFKERGFRENGFIFNSDNSIEILDSYNPLIFFYLIKKSELKPILVKIVESKIQPKFNFN